MILFGKVGIARTLLFKLIKQMIPLREFLNSGNYNNLLKLIAIRFLEYWEKLGVGKAAQNSENFTMHFRKSAFTDVNSR